MIVLDYDRRMCMLGTIIGTNDNEVLIKLNINLYEFGSLINYYVIMEHEDRKIVGEIVDIRDNIAYANLLGEILGENFVPGVIRKPAFSSTVKLVSKEKVPLLISVDKYEENKG